MISTGRLVSIGDVESVFVSGGHHTLSADRKIHERFLNDVINDRMSPEALVFYGMCLQPNDVMFITPWVAAMQRMIDKNPDVEAHIRLRDGKSFALFALESEQTTQHLAEFLKEAGKRLKEEIPTDATLSPRLSDLVRKLNCSFA